MTTSAETIQRFKSYSLSASDKSIRRDNLLVAVVTNLGIKDCKSPRTSPSKIFDNEPENHGVVNLMKFAVWSPQLDTGMLWYL